MANDRYEVPRGLSLNCFLGPTLEVFWPILYKKLISFYPKDKLNIKKSLDRAPVFSPEDFEKSVPSNP